MYSTSERDLSIPNIDCEGVLTGANVPTALLDLRRRTRIRESGLCYFETLLTAVNI